MQSSDSALRTIGVRSLAVAGGPDALAAVKAAIDDKDEGVQDQAVRTLSNWPNNWPGDAGVAEPLLMLARSGKKTSHQVLGLRGYLQYVQGDKKLSDADKVAKVKDLLPLASRPEEKRLAAAVLGTVPTSGSLELLTTLAADPAIAEEVYSAIVSLAGKDIQGLSKDQRRSAIQTVLEKSRNRGTRRKAEEALKGI